MQCGPNTTIATVAMGCTRHMTAPTAQYIGGAGCRPTAASIGAAPMTHPGNRINPYTAP